jgi:DNA-binding MarR family transcriptional regulator
MNQQEVLILAKKMGVMISLKPKFEQSVVKFGKQIIKQFSPLTKTQAIYLEALAEPKSLQNLADQFGCTTQNALKMIRALEARKLISKEKLFKQHVGAWSYYYQRKS